MSELFKKCYNYSKRNPLHIALIILVLLLSYGFYATNYTYHIDQLVTEYYNSNVMIGAGRWSAPVIHILTNWMNFAPFWHTLLMAFLLFVSALVFGQVFKTSSDDKIPDSAILVFSAIYVSFPVIIAQITFPILNIALSYLLSATALWLITSKEKTSIKEKILVIVLLVISVDLYESFASVFLVGYFGVMLIKCTFTQEKTKFKDFILTAFKGALFLLIAIIADFIISKAVCLICCGTTQFWYESNTDLLWFHGIIDAVIWLVRTLFAFYIIGAHSSFFVFLFDVAVICGFIVFTVLSVRKKNIFPVFIYSCVAVSSLALAIIMGRAPDYSQSQALPVFVALIIMLLFCMTQNKKRLKAVLSVILIIVTLNQTKIINSYAVDNFERYEYETDLLRDVGKELADYPVKTKPVAFVADSNILPSSLKTARSETHPIVKLYRSVFEKIFDRILPGVYLQKMGDWFGGEDFKCTADLAGYLSNTPRAYYSFIERTDFKDNLVSDVYKAMKHLGYPVINCTQEEYDEAVKVNVEPPRNTPYCILETDSLIVVKFFRTVY